MPRGIRFADLLMTGSALALTTVALLLWATRLEVQATHASARLAELETQRAAGEAAITEWERRAGEDAALRQAVAARVEDLEARCLSRPSTALGEASRARPKGVWLTKLCWADAEIKAEGRTWGDAPATEFAGRLARSPHFAQVFTVPAPAGGAAGAGRFLLFARSVRP
jgi:Tfp pilus assembly protein PilN